MVIVGAGSSTRMGPGTPKQFRELGGIPLIMWSVRHFCASPAVREVVLVVPETHLRNMELLVRRESLQKVSAIVPGGARRQDSVAAGIRATTGSAIVAIHDAARPFPPQNLGDAVERAAEVGAVIYGVPVAETLKRIDYPRVVQTVSRDHVWAAQTPQVFRRDVLELALTHCERESLEVTDEAGAVEALGYRVEIIPGTRTNLKLTNPEDWMLAEALAREVGLASENA